uniref:Protein kinase domain-containing protein n=1 Tax=Oryza punctata TaxID=4537 RepID=A0A0E0K068_ORYPU
MLAYLNLSHNLLQDKIPYTFGKLSSIVTLGLSRNSLLRTIPESLANLTCITNLKLSFNKLEGTGKRALCGLPRLGFLACANNTCSGKLHILKYVLPSIASFVIVASLNLLTTKALPALSSVMDGINNHLLVSYHEIVHATNNFSEGNLLGIRNFGKVFKGQLSNGSIVAIKVLDMQSEKVTKNLDIEFDTLRMALHRNFILLHSEGRQSWGFSERLNIILDVSMALEYLHHHHVDVVAT